MELKEKYGETALIAGASEGIGAAFASALAKEGFGLILVARRMEPLQRLADELADRYGTIARCLACDLSEEGAADQVIGSLEGAEPGVLIYNAALSSIGSFVAHPADGHRQAAVVNMITPLKLVHSLGTVMLDRGRGAVILMSSMAGLQGSGFLATYAATKAFSRILAESLWYEWRDRGVDVMACCAGATATPGYIRSGPAKAGIFAPAVQQPDEVVSECFRRIGKVPSFITGRGNRLASFFMHRLLPRRMAVQIMGDNTRRIYRLE
jgi:short-subunit dehydrogenase